MSFNIALSGIAAAQTDLDVTANNIANVSTVGFKESRAEFESVYANSLFTNAKTKVGDGVATAAVAQQFHQGSLKSTENPLDLAITGSGFFATAENLEDRDLRYTRDGEFKLNSENYIIDNRGNFLQAYSVNDAGTSSAVSLSTTEAIQLPETAGTPVPTSEIGITCNLPSVAETHPLAKFDADDESTYNYTTSLGIYDSLGEKHIATTYYVKPEDASYADTNQWVTFVQVDGKPVDVWDKAAGTPANGDYGLDSNKDGIADTVADLEASIALLQTQPATAATTAKIAELTAAVEKGGTGTASYTDAEGKVHTGAVLTFDAVGNYSGSSPESITLQSLGIDDPSSPTAADGAGILGAGADGKQRLTLNFKEPTANAGVFQTTNLEQDGLTVGRLTGVEIDEDGLVKVTYSNGTSQPLARVAIARFRNEQGLSQRGSSWIPSQDSGDPIAGEANSGSFGSINSSALEQSNVNLTTELVDLIAAQRNFQANSRALEISNTLQQTILQIR